MKAKYKVALAMIASFALGAAAVRSLHAQPKPFAYVVAEVTVTYQEGYTKEFIPAVVKSIEDGGGEFLARGGETVSFVGNPPAPRMIVFKFESMDKAQIWWNSASRRDAEAIGDKYAFFRIYGVEGVSP